MCLLLPFINYLVVLLLLERSIYFHLHAESESLIGSRVHQKASFALGQAHIAPGGEGLMVVVVWWWGILDQDVIHYDAWRRKHS